MNPGIHTAVGTLPILRNSNLASLVPAGSLVMPRNRTAIAGLFHRMVELLRKLPVGFCASLTTRVVAAAISVTSIMTRDRFIQICLGVVKRT